MVCFRSVRVEAPTPFENCLPATLENCHSTRSGVRPARDIENRRDVVQGSNTDMEHTNENKASSTPQVESQPFLERLGYHHG
jgi:hypothetical protein